MGPLDPEIEFEEEDDEDALDGLEEEGDDS
jgi:hypothetical protein